VIFILFLSSVKMSSFKSKEVELILTILLLRELIYSLRSLPLLSVVLRKIPEALFSIEIWSIILDLDLTREMIIELRKD